MQQRVHWVDVVKGLLILIVVFHHIPQNAIVMGYENSFWINYDNMKIFYCSWFMAAFFIVSGMCSNFNKPLKFFALTAFKTIILPAVIIKSGIDVLTILYDKGLSAEVFLVPIKRMLLLGNDWFLTALFVARLLYWGVNKIAKKTLTIFLFLFCLLFLGFILHDLHVRNFLFHQHAFAMTIFLGVGQFIKEKVIPLDGKIRNIPVRMVEVAVSGGYFVLMFLFCWFNLRIPALNAGFKVSFSDIPLYLCFSLLGSNLIFLIGKLVNENNFFEYVGKNSILVYLLHIFFLKILLKNFRMYENSVFDCILIAVITFVVTVLLCMFCSKVFNTKYFKFVIGKF